MRNIIIFFSLFLLCYHSGFSQISVRTTQLTKPDVKLPNILIEKEAKELLLSYYPQLGSNQNELVLVNHQRSLLGHHILFAHYHQGLRVYQSEVKINISNSGSVLSILNNLILFEGKAPVHPSNFNINSAESIYALGSTEVQPCYLKVQKNESGVYEEVLLNSKNEVIMTRTLDLFFTRKDTVVQTKIFKPDPLTTANKLYGADGGLWVNKNGLDYPELTAQRVTVPVTVGFSNDTFYTSSPYITIADIESPQQDPYKTILNNFDFTRSSPHFREMMALYHIEEYRKYLKSIGYGFEAMFNTFVDVAAYMGQDQSRFSFSNGYPSIYFGTGGVPDAEDADVIIHEYTHAITYYITPNTSNGNERIAIEEANCDFMACQYSKALSDFNWRQVFNWDGHNVFWDGRNANSPNKYPKDLDPDFYKSSVIWSSMLNDISLDLGRDITTRILIASMYSYDNSLSMQQCADLLVQADSLLYERAHFEPLKNRLAERGFMVWTGINQDLSSEKDLSVFNSEGFALGNGNLHLEYNLPGGMVYEIIDMQGNIVSQQTEPHTSFDISPQSFHAGMYVLRVSSASKCYLSKLVRLH